MTISRNLRIVLLATMFMSNLAVAADSVRESVSPVTYVAESGAGGTVLTQTIFHLYTLGKRAHLIMLFPAK